jgi:hypothetical protein
VRRPHLHRARCGALPYSIALLAVQPPKLSPKSVRSGLVVAALWLAFPAAVFADRASEVAALEARCEQEREAKIKPLREMEIKNCLANRSNLDYCTTFWKDYGNAVRLPNGAMLPRMFGDLPSCVAAFEARKEYELHGHE